MKHSIKNPKTHLVCPSKTRSLILEWSSCLNFQPIWSVVHLKSLRNLSRTSCPRFHHHSSKFLRCDWPSCPALDQWEGSVGTHDRWPILRPDRQTSGGPNQSSAKPCFQIQIQILILEYGCLCVRASRKDPNG